MGFFDDFRKGRDQGRESREDRPPVELAKVGTWRAKQWLLATVAGILGLWLILVIVSNLPEDSPEPPKTEAPAVAEETGRVTVNVSAVESGVADPYPGDDPTFNDSHVIYRAKVTVKNGTPDQVAIDSYLEGAGGLSVNSPDFEVVGPGASWSGEVYFGWLKSDPPPTRIRIDDPQNAEELYDGKV